MAPHTVRSTLAEMIDGPVWEAVERVLRNPSLIAQEVARRQETAGNRKDVLEQERQRYLRHIALCDKDLKRWEAAYLGEAINLADFKQKKVDIDARRASIETELVKLDEQVRLLEQAHVEMATLTDYCQRVAHNLKNFTLEEKRLACEALKISVTWHPDKPLEIQGSIPVGIENNEPTLHYTHNTPAWVRRKSYASELG
jgi:hypothetical protein